MVGYTVFGGFIFAKLEAPNEAILKNDVQESRRWHVEMLWNLTYELNVLYPENWTRMADEIMANYTRKVFVATKNNGWDGTDVESELQWTFAGALLYSITVVTTIGKLLFINNKWLRRLIQLFLYCKMELKFCSQCVTHETRTYNTQIQSLWGEWSPLAVT